MPTLWGMTHSVTAPAGQAVLDQLTELVDRHRGADVELPALLDELGALLRRGRAAVRRAQRAAEVEVTVAKPPSPAPAAPAAPAPRPPAAPAPRPPAASTAPASKPAAGLPVAPAPERRRSGMLGAIVVVGLVVLAALVLLLAGSAVGMELAAGGCVAPAEVAACSGAGPSGVR